jgi:hypothetical protein
VACSRCGSDLLDRLLILEPHQDGDGPDHQGEQSPAARHRGRRRRRVLTTIATAVALIWAGVALWPSPSAALTVALYQAGQPDTFRVQRLGAPPGPIYRHPELQGDGAIAGPVAVGRTVVVVRGDAVWTLAGPGAPGHRLASGCRVLPSADADRIWVVSCEVPVTLRAFDLAGTALTGDLDLPPGYDNPLSITSDGVALLASSTLPHPAVIVWDSRSGRGVGATDEQVTPVSASTAVIQTAGSTQLFDVGSRQSRSVAVPAGTTILGGTLSPDGKLIAVAMTTGIDPGSSETELGVIDVRRRTLRAVAGSVTVDGYWELQWSKTGDRLVAGDGQPRPGLIARISLYDLGHGKVRHWSVAGGPFAGFVVT